MAKKAMSAKKAVAVFTPSIVVVVAIMLALIIASTMFWEDISLFLYGRAQKADASALADGDALCEDIVEEGTVLLKNEKDSKGVPALPLSSEEIKKVNVFGWAAYDWMTLAFGSGYSNTSLQKVKFFDALTEANIEYNQDLYNLYKEYYTGHSRVYGPQDDVEYRGGVSFGSEEIFVLREPSKDQYLGLAESIANFSDVGLVVIGRTGSESKDLEMQQVKQTTPGSNSKKTVTDRHYLQLSTEEEEMIEAANMLCSKVIVILNTANTMETGFIEDPEIDAALLVGITGLTGVRGVVDVLRGYKEEPIPVRDENGNPTYNEDGTAIYEKNADGTVKTETVKVSPSGRTADTYAYDIVGTTPSAVNQGNKGKNEDGAATIYAKDDGFGYRGYVDYSEGIYVGYKWFETADAEGYWNNVSNDYGAGYDGVVQYPFGYGLSYTDFTWIITDVKVNGERKLSGELGKDDKISITVEVKNNADPDDPNAFAGSDVVELYYHAPYIKGGVGKAEVVLADFAKTGVIKPGATDIVTLEVSAQSMASYDCYDANENGHTGYELDEGEYRLQLMKNSHELGNMGDTQFNGSPAAVKEAVITYTLSRKINYDTDEKTGATVENRFTNKDGKGNDQTIDQADLDGSHEETPVKYLSRADFAGTYPQRITKARNKTAEAKAISEQRTPTEEQLAYAGYTGDNAKRNATKNGLTLEDVLGTKDYDDEIWTQLIDNITDAELYTLVSDGYFKTAAIDSIKKASYVDLDGPLGFNTRVTGGGTCEFMAYPSETMLAQTWNVDLAYAFGMSVGRERQSMEGLRGWYAPGANTHRNPFGGRNGEYYSEDGVLAGKICAGTVSGAKDMGVYSYVKHFVVNDSEFVREGLFTFLTEQTLREVYLKPFEIMIKEGGGNALMTSMNRLGRVWSGANYGLCTELIRGEWGFHGTLVTDWVNSTDTYMPAYRGIWAGNDIWLSNGIGNTFDIIRNDTAYKVSEKVAHDVLWTIVDTINTETAFDPNAADNVDLGEGASYNLTWVWYVVIVEVVLAAAVVTMGVFLTKAILRGRKKAQE